MFLREQATQTVEVRSPNRSYFGVNSQSLLKFLSSLLLPLMLGIFTIVVTFQQQSVARQQRLEDKNESRLQREQDWNIAQLAQAAQNKATNDQYRDEVLIAYIKEIGDLLKENNGSLTQIPLIHTLARAKTLNTIRQLDGPRQVHILRFLYEAKQLFNTNKSLPLDISTAILVDIDFRKFTPSKTIEKMSLVGVYLQNCTFTGMLLKELDFSSAHMSYVDFSSAELSNSNFSNARFEDVTFAFARLDNLKFSYAEFYDINLSKVKLQDTDLSYARLFNVDSSHIDTFNADLTFAILKNISFESAELRDVKFSFAGLQAVNFSFGILMNSNFSVTRIMQNVDFSFTNIFLGDFTFAWNFFGSARFYHSKMANTTLNRCHCDGFDFSHADLKNTSFVRAVLNNTKFVLANLQDADFTGTNITDEQLQSALSIRNARLPNGTLGQGRNLVENGDADCSTSIQKHWQMTKGSIVVMPLNTNQSQCQFILQSTMAGAIMSQEISLVDIYDSSFWTRSNVELQAEMSDGVSIELISKDNHSIVLTKYLANFNMKRIVHSLSCLTKTLEITITFDRQTSWCDNIEVFIDYGT